MDRSRTPRSIAQPTARMTRRGGACRRWRRAGALAARRSALRSSRSIRRAAPAPAPPRCCCSRSTCYGVVKGGHAERSPRRCRTSATPRPTALGFRISEVALAGQHELSRDDILTLAGITGRSSLLFLDAGADARAALDQSVDRRRHRAQALSRPPAHRHQGAQALRALAEGRRVSLIAADGTVLEPYVPARFAVAAAGGRPRRRARRPRISRRASTAIRRSRGRSKPRCWSPSGAGTCI